MIGVFKIHIILSQGILIILFVYLEHIVGVSNSFEIFENSNISIIYQGMLIYHNEDSCKLFLNFSEL